MTFGHPLLLLTLLVIPAAVGAYLALERRRARYAVRYTNLDVLALVAGERQWRRYLPAAVFLLTLATLCVALARPHVRTHVASDRATVVLVLDVSGSMEATDVKPTRLAAAQRAIHLFLAKVPSRVRVGLILFAGEAQVATPPTADHELVGQAVDDASEFRGFGGTAIGDALATAVQLGLQSVGLQSKNLASYSLPSTAAPRGRTAASTLVTILFLSDGHQTQGVLTPLQGAARARAAGIPVFTVSLGTTGNTTLRGFPNTPPPGTFVAPNGGFGGFGRRGLSPDPRTLRAIAEETGGQFFRAKTAGDVNSAYSKLGSSIASKPAKTEVTDEFLIGGAILLVLAGILGAVWSPRLP
jgi:Ca-activated chloride channel family protein